MTFKRIYEISTNEKFIKSRDEFLLEQEERQAEELKNSFYKYVEDNEFASDVFFANGMKKFFEKANGKEIGLSADTLAFKLKSSNKIETNDLYVFSTKKYNKGFDYVEGIDDRLKDAIESAKSKIDYEDSLLVTFRAVTNMKVGSSNGEVIFESPLFAAVIHSLDFIPSKKRKSAFVSSLVSFFSLTSDGSYELLNDDGFEFDFKMSNDKFECYLTGKNKKIFSDIKNIFKQNYIYIRYKKLSDGTHYAIIGQESVPGGRSHAYENAKTSETGDKWRQYAPVKDYIEDNYLTSDGKGLGDLKMKANGKTLFTDKDIHKKLQELIRANALIDTAPDVKWSEVVKYDAGKSHVNTVEGFEILDVENEDSAVAVLGYLYEFIKDNFAEGSVANHPIVQFEPREKQKPCSDFIEKSLSENSKILINAAPRYGKTAVTLFSAIKRLGANKILVLTGQPTNTLNAWKNAMLKFDFGEGFDYFNKDTGMYNRSSEKFLAFLSFQSGNREEEKFETDTSIDDKKVKKMFTNKLFREIEKKHIDLLIIDECHFAASTTNSKSIIDAIDFDNMIELSGTPYKKLRNGEYTKDQIFSYTILDDYKRFKDLSENDKKKDDFVQLNLVSYEWPKIRELNPEKREYYNELKDTFASSEFTWESFFTKYNEENTSALSYFVDHMLLPSGNPHMKSKGIKNVLVVVDRVAYANAIENATRKGIQTINISGNKNNKLKPEAVDAMIRDEEGPSLIITCGRFCSGVDLPHLDAVVFCCSCNSPEIFLQTAMRTCTQYSQEEILENGRKENGWVYMMDNVQKISLAQKKAMLLSDMNESKKSTMTKTDFKELSNALPHWYLSHESNGEEYVQHDAEDTAYELDKYNAIKNNDLSDFINDDFSNEAYDIEIGDIESSDGGKLETEFSSGSEDFKRPGKKSPSKKSGKSDNKEDINQDMKRFLELKENLTEAFKRIPYLMKEKDVEIKDAKDFIGLFSEPETESRYGMDSACAKKVIEYSNDKKKVRLISNLSMFFDVLNSKKRSLDRLDDKEVWENFSDSFLKDKLSKLTFQPIKDILYEKEDLQGKDIVLLSTRISKCNADIESKAKSVTHIIYENAGKKINEGEVVDYLDYLYESNEYDDLDSIDEKATPITDELVGTFEWINKKLANAYKLKGDLVFARNLKELEELLS